MLGVSLLEPNELITLSAIVSKDTINLRMSQRP